VLLSDSTADGRRCMPTLCGVFIGDVRVVHPMLTIQESAVSSWCRLQLPWSCRGISA